MKIPRKDIWGNTVYDVYDKGKKTGTIKREQGLFGESTKFVETPSVYISEDDPCYEMGFTMSIPFWLVMVLIYSVNLDGIHRLYYLGITGIIGICFMFLSYICKIYVGILYHLICIIIIMAETGFVSEIIKYIYTGG